MEFAESGRHFGLEMQAPWADLVLQGKKEIETRRYPLSPSLSGLLYKHVAIIEQESVTLMFLPSQYIQFGVKDDRELG